MSFRLHRGPKVLTILCVTWAKPVAGGGGGAGETKKNWMWKDGEGQGKEGPGSCFADHRVFSMHADPGILSYSHDASSSVSQRVLKELQARAQAPSIVQGGSGGAQTKDSGSRTATPADEGHAEQQPSAAQQYLAKASSAPAGTQDVLFQLDVVDRRRATPDQWRTVGAYLRRTRPSQIEALKDEAGPIVVNWDDGEAVQTVEGTQRLLAKLENEDDAGRSKRGTGRGTGCTLM